MTDGFVRDVNNRRVELQAERTRLEEQLTAFEDQVREAVNPELLDCLPIAGVDLDFLPDEVSRPRFEALGWRSTTTTKRGLPCVASP